MDRILLIDDNPAILSMLQQHLLLRARRSEIHCAVDRGEAEALIGSYTYSLVIADLALDKYSLEGLAIIRHLHYLPLRPRIIVFTGCVTPELEAEARREGADAVVSKGSSLAGLTRLIDQLMSCELAEVSVQQSAPSAL